LQPCSELVNAAGDWQGSWNNNSGVSGTLTLSFDHNGSISGPRSADALQCSFAANQRSASRAAMQPVPAAVMA
jgi:hypothetical protein